MLAELAESERAVGAKARESYQSLRSDFEAAPQRAGADREKALRDWLEPVADLIDLTLEESQAQGRSSPPTRPTVDATELATMLHDLDGEWKSKMEALRAVPPDAYEPAVRDVLATLLATQADPEVRAAGCRLLGAWSRTEPLLALAEDAHLIVRKSAMYYLGDTPKSGLVAEAAWRYLSEASGTTAQEALRTYVHHAPRDEATNRLLAIAYDDPREGVQAGAIGHLADLAAATEVSALELLLLRPPAVTWAVHIAVLDAMQEVEMPARNIEHLRGVDNLDLTLSVLQHS